MTLLYGKREGSGLVMALGRQSAHDLVVADLVPIRYSTSLVATYSVIECDSIRHYGVTKPVSEAVT